MIDDAGSHAGPALRELPDAVWADVDLLQVRGKALGAGQLEARAREWVERLADLSTRIVVNDRMDVAIGTGADGVHLGQEDLPIPAARGMGPAGFLIGATARSRGDLLTVQAAGADYAGLGAFFASPTKPGAPALDPARAGLAKPVPGLEIPVLAIGGVTVDRITDVLRWPAVTGIAVSSAVQAAADPAAVIGRVRRALDRAWQARCAGAVG